MERGKGLVYLQYNRQQVSAQSAKSSLAEVGDNQNARDNGDTFIGNRMLITTGFSQTKGAFTNHISDS